MHVSAEHHIVGHDNSVSHLAVVGHVAAGHQIAVATQGCDAIFLLRGAIDRHRFAEDVTIADNDLRRGPLVAQVLRFGANHNSREEVIIATDGGVTGQRDIVFQPRATPDFDMRADDTVVADANFFVEFRAGINDGGMGYDCGHTNQLSGMNLEINGGGEGYHAVSCQAARAGLRSG